MNFLDQWGEKTIFTGIFQKIKEVLIYQPPMEPKPFILREAADDNKETNATQETVELAKNAHELETLLRYSHRLSGFMKKVLLVLHDGKWSDKATALKAECLVLEKQQAELNAIQLSYSSNEGMDSECPVSTSLEENQKIIESLYQLPLNKDIVIRKLQISAQSPVKTMLVFMDGLVDKKIINMSVLQPLMRLGREQQELYAGDLVSTVLEQCLPSGQASRADNFREIQDAINTGDSVLFFDGIDQAITLETKGFEHRSIDRPTTEQSVRGSQNAFTEVLRVNTALVRTMLHSSDLVTEMIPVGMRGRSNCAVMYLKSVANLALVTEVKRRIEGIRTDLIPDSGVLEHFIVDAPRNPLPQTLSTERPDRLVTHIAEGRVAILSDGSPFGHIVPISLFTLLHSADDFSLNLYYSNMLRIIRLSGAFLSMLLPAAYLAISTFHQEAIPTDLLLSITAARSAVPFPTIIEILLMEGSFELVREGGLRIPGILGSTIGIVGALILGQAAVAAKIVSPIMVIIIAVTGLASYSIPDYRLASALRLFRFLFILLAMGMGLVGMACGFMVFTAVLCSMKSFGMPYLAPLAPKTIPGGDVILRTPAHAQKRRPDELNPQDVTRQGAVSRSWIKERPTGGDGS